MLDADQCKIVQVKKDGEWVDTHFERLEPSDEIRFLQPNRSQFADDSGLGSVPIIIREMPYLKVDRLDGSELYATDNCKAEQVTQTVVCHKPAHVYEVSGGQYLNFIHKKGDALVRGTTNEDLLNVLIHRTEVLDGQQHCAENVAALEHLREALKFFEQRSANIALSNKG